MKNRANHRRRGSTASLALLAAAVSAAPQGEMEALTAARVDLAHRLKVPVETVRVREDADQQVLNAVAAGCVRRGAPVEEAFDEGAVLVLIAAGQEHYYHAMPGEPYRYCELPSTKKRGPIGPPIR